MGGPQTPGPLGPVILQAAGRARGARAHVTGRVGRRRGGSVSEIMRRCHAGRWGQKLVPYVCVDLSHVPAPTNLKVAAQGANTSEPDPDQPTEEGRKEEAGSLKRTKVDCGTVLRESTCRDPVSPFELPWPHSSWPSVLLRPHVRLCRGPRDGR